MNRFVNYSFIVKNQPNDQEKKLYIILEGSVELFAPIKRNYDSRQQWLSTLKKGAIFGVEEFFSNKESQIGARSLINTKLAILEKNAMLNIIQFYKHDQERFFMIRDLINNMNITRGLGLSCLFCQSYFHSYLKCPNVSLKLQPQIVIAKFNLTSKQQDRHILKRTKQRTLNSMSQRKTVELEIIQFIYKYLGKQYGTEYTETPRIDYEHSSKQQNSEGQEAVITSILQNSIHPYRKRSSQAENRNLNQEFDSMFKMESKIEEESSSSLVDEKEFKGTLYKKGTVFSSKLIKQQDEASHQSLRSQSQFSQVSNNLIKIPEDQLSPYLHSIKKSKQSKQQQYQQQQQQQCLSPELRLKRKLRQHKRRGSLVCKSQINYTNQLINNQEQQQSNYQNRQVNNSQKIQSANNINSSNQGNSLIWNNNNSNSQIGINNTINTHDREGFYQEDLSDLKLPTLYRYEDNLEQVQDNSPQNFERQQIIQSFSQQAQLQLLALFQQLPQQPNSLEQLYPSNNINLPNQNCNYIFNKVQLCQNCKSPALPLQKNSHNIRKCDSPNKVVNSFDNESQNQQQSIQNNNQNQIQSYYQNTHPNQTVYFTETIGGIGGDKTGIEQDENSRVLDFCIELETFNYKKLDFYFWKDNLMTNFDRQMNYVSFFPYNNLDVVLKNANHQFVKFKNERKRKGLNALALKKLTSIGGYGSQQQSPSSLNYSPLNTKQRSNQIKKSIFQANPESINQNIFFSNQESQLVAPDFLKQK